jgi:tetratricopeptide (TPR) repeat protein
MLFDLSSGKRRRVVQVVYATLALLMGGSLVLFGIGSDAPGGILDALGLGGGGGGTSTSPQYEEQIDDAESKLETNPKDQQALLDLARYHYLSAVQTGVTTNPDTGVPEVSEDAHQELEDAVAAWTKYLKTDPQKANVSVANNVVQSYVLLNDAGGAAETQQIVAEANPSASAYGALANYLYFDGEITAGDAAAAKAVQEADPSERDRIEKLLAQTSEAAKKQKKKLAKLPEGGATGEPALQDPFGGLGGSSTVPPTTP